MLAIDKVGFVVVTVERPASIESDGGGRLNWGGGPICRVSVVTTVAVGPGCGGAGIPLVLYPSLLTGAVEATGRAPGCGAGGDDDDCVVVAGTWAGVVRVGGGLVAVLFEDAVSGVMASAFAAVVGAIGEFL